MANVLIIDDDWMICDGLSRLVEMIGHQAVYALSLEEGLTRARSGSFDVVYLDVNMPDGSGLEALPTLRQSPSSPEIIIITGVGNPDGAELAIRSGAWDYIQKPFSVDAVTLPLKRVIQYREARQRAATWLDIDRRGIIGNSPKLKECLDLIARAARTPAAVLIVGETGTGKELCAQAIHRNSARAAGPFVVVDCTALPKTLVESILFGYERGAFTGADRSTEGMICQADGGTLFLDEVGELPVSLQKAFLRVIQEHRFRPIGARRELASDFRLVAATNRDLEEMVVSGRFRSDLLFRLRSLTIELPPLRERMEDIKALTTFHIAQLCERYGIGLKGFSSEFFDVLSSYSWPGNVRELFNTLERTLVTAFQEPMLFAKHLPTQIRVSAARASFDVSPPPPPPGQAPSATQLVIPVPPEGCGSLKSFRTRVIDAVEKKYLESLMVQTRFDIREACRISQLSPSRLYGLLKKHRLRRD